MMKIPVILDTDIGHDIDDAWAVTMLLRRPELDPLLITTTTGETDRRCGIVHRLLAAAERTDIGLAAGKPVACNNEVIQYELVSRDDAPASYPDAAEAIRDAVLSRAPQQVTLICIGPQSNIAEVVERFPEIVPSIDLVAMAGSIEHGVGGSQGKIAEWNIKCDIAAAQKVFRAPWHSMTITPLDTCGMVQLSGNWLEKLRNSGSLQQELAAQFLAWLHRWDSDGVRNIRNSNVPQSRTSVLFDTVAIHLAYSHDFLEMQEMNLVVDDDGFLRESPDGKTVNVARNWRDLPGYRQMLEQTILKQ
jgi:inosine-uridine nucleoside N-ribohydrolase